MSTISNPNVQNNTNSESTIFQHTDILVPSTRTKELLFDSVRTLLGPVRHLIYKICAKVIRFQSFKLSPVLLLPASGISYEPYEVYCWQYSLTSTSSTAGHFFHFTRSCLPSVFLLTHATIELLLPTRIHISCWMGQSLSLSTVLEERASLEPKVQRKAGRLCS